MPEVSRPVLIAMDHAFRIRDWRELYETAESRKRVHLGDWMKMYTKHDSRGFKRVLRLRTAEKVLLGWYLILQVASKMPCRGLLAASGGPLDALDLADKSGISEKVFAAALDALVSDQIGWLERVDWDAKLDFEANLARLGMRRSGQADKRQGPAGNGREQQADAGGNDQEKRQSAPRGAADNGSLPAGNSTPRQGPADDGRDQQTTAGSGTDKKRREEIRVPLPSPKGDSADELIDFDEAKQLLHDLFLREKRHWSSEEMTLLGQVTPFARSLWPLIHTWFSLAKENPDHAVWQITKAKQELTTFLRDWNGEIDKMQRHAALFMGSAGSSGEKEPELWREVLLWVRGEQIRLPDTFAQLDRDFRQEYRANLDAYREHLAKK